MPTVDDCINNIFTDLNNPADPGASTKRRYNGRLLTAEGNKIVIQPVAQVGSAFLTPGYIILSGTQD